jgi:COMPASS component SWD3
MTLLATSSADNSINIYSIPPNPTPDSHFKHIRTLRAHLAGVNAIAWSPVGPPYTLVSASDDKSILLWSPLGSDFPIAPSPLTGHSNYVYSLCFSPKGNMLVSGSFDEAVFLWDVRSGRVMRSLPAHSDPVGGVDFLRDGTMVVSCAGDGLIRIWDASTGQCLRTLVDEDRKPVTSVKFSPNGKFLLAWTLDNCVRMWNYIEGRCVKTYQGHLNSQYSLEGAVGSYSYDNGGGERRLEAFVASGSEDGDIVAWDVSSKDILWREKAHRDVVLGIDFGRTKEGKGLLVSGGKDRDVKIWMLEADEAERDFFAEKQDRHRDGGVDADVDMDMDMDMDGVVEGPTVYGNGTGTISREADGNAMLIDRPTPDVDHS